jgi:hypothetical protein
MVNKILIDNNINKNYHNISDINFNIENLYSNWYRNIFISLILMISIFAYLKNLNNKIYFKFEIMILIIMILYIIYIMYITHIKNIYNMIYINHNIILLLLLSLFIFMFFFIITFIKNK